MSSQEVFFQIKEYFSLADSISSLQSSIDNENLRISKLNDIKENRELENDESEKRLEELNQTYLTLEKELNLFEAKITQLEKNKSNIKNEKENQAFLNSHHEISNKLEETNERLFMVLEKMEELKKEFIDYESFKEGFSKTFNDVQHEVGQNIQVLQTELGNLNNRSDSLLNDFNDHLKLIINNVCKKINSPIKLTQIVSGKCKVCNYAIHRGTEDDVEIRFNFHTCPSCKRLILPKEF